MDIVYRQRVERLSDDGPHNEQHVFHVTSYVRSAKIKVFECVSCELNLAFYIKSSNSHTLVLITHIKAFHCICCGLTFYPTLETLKPAHLFSLQCELLLGEFFLVAFSPPLFRT